MSPDRAESVRQLFRRATECAPEELGRVLSEGCRGDDALEAQVRALLEADRAVPERFLAGAPSRGDVLPERIGSYRIVRRIGEGGMGVVFEADQENPRRRVALKLLKTGILAADAQRRFEYEAQVLADLLHPGIAQVYEAGMESIGGIPASYFVMELIPQARSICEYATVHRLDTAKRLALFADVCDAVQHAHQKGVIHRDLKPSNIVVDAEGRARIIDFGVARPLPGEPGVDVRHTSAGQVIGTLPYMSPEQVGGGAPGRDVDVRSDVYSLGVVLYELLCDRLPYDVGRGDLVEAARVIREQAPERPSAAHRVLRGDLETILLKALSKDRDHRYQSAGDLARDIRHFLAGEPIQARRESTFYVLRKAVSRYRVAILALLCFCVLIAGSAILAWSLLLRARTAQQEAQLNLGQSLVAQARALRHSGRIGQRLSALDALARVAAAAPSLEARNEAIAAMALIDLRMVRRLPYDGTCFFDRALERCAAVLPDGSIDVRRLADDCVLARIAPPAGGMEEFHWATLVDRFLIRLFDPPAGDRRLEVWTVSEARLHLALDDVPRRARHDVSPDGTVLAVGRTDQAVYLYDLNSAQVLKRLPVDRVPSYVTFDPGGRRLALYHGNYADAACILDLETGDCRPAFDSPLVAWSVAWHPDGKLLAGASGTQVELWDCASQSRVAVLAHHNQPVVHAAFSPDGTLLVTCSWDGQCIFWDLYLGRPALETVLSNPVFGPSGDTIASRGLDDAPTHNLLHELVRGGERIQLGSVGAGDYSTLGDGAFHPNGQLFFSGESLPGTPDSLLRAVDLPTGRELGRRIVSGLSPCLRVDPGGRFLYGICEDRLVRWPIRVETQRITIDPPEIIHSEARGHVLELSGDGRWGIMMQGDALSFAVVDLERRALVRSIAASPQSAHPCLSTDGRWAAIGAWRGTTGEVWDVRSGVRVTEFPLEHAGWLAFSPDDRWLVSCDTKRVRLYETESWRMVRETPGLGQPRISADGRTLATRISLKAIRLIDLESLEELAVLEGPEAIHPIDHRFSADGVRLASFTAHAELVYIWDLRLVRKRLSSMGLDWNQPPLPPAAARTHAPWRVVQFDMGDPRTTDPSAPHPAPSASPGE